MTSRNDSRIFTRIFKESSPEHLANAGVSQVYICGATVFLLYITDLPDFVCNISIYSDDTTLHSKCDQVFDLLNLSYDLA